MSDPLLLHRLQGMPLAILYFVFLFRFHRGKAAVPADGEGY